MIRKSYNYPDNYVELMDFFYGSYEIVDGYNFYVDIFPNIENHTPRELLPDANDEEHGEWITNPIFLYKDEKKDHMTSRIMFKNRWLDDYYGLIVGSPLTLCGGLTYRGKKNSLANARQMNAIIFDIDGVGYKEIKKMFELFTEDISGNMRESAALPWPTYITLSGNGVHLYYVFDNPLNLFPNIKRQLYRAKKELTEWIWRYQITSKQKSREFQGINQGFRMVGSINAKHGTEVIAYKTGNRVTLDYMNAFIRNDDNKVNTAAATKLTLDKAKALYPEWHQRRIIEGQPRKHWTNKIDLYNWWLNRRFDKELVGGHRYSYLVCLAAYACKCGVSKRKLRADMKIAFEHLKTIAHDNEFTMDDVNAAMKAFDKEYYNYTLENIMNLSGLSIERNKRNTEQYNKYAANLGDKALPRQKWHLESARYMRDRTYPGNSWIEGNGRPSAAAAVVDYRRKHPEGKPKDCIAATGLSKNTVYKHWKGAE